MCVCERERERERDGESTHKSNGMINERLHTVCEPVYTCAFACMSSIHTLIRERKMGTGRNSQQYRQKHGKTGSIKL